MLSKNNNSYRLQKSSNKKQKFTIKKLSVGVASVLIGWAAFMGTQSANADSVQNNFQEENNNIEEVQNNNQSEVDSNTTNKIEPVQLNDADLETSNSINDYSNVENSQSLNEENSNASDNQDLDNKLEETEYNNNLDNSITTDANNINSVENNDLDVSHTRNLKLNESNAELANNNTYLDDNKLKSSTQEEVTETKTIKRVVFYVNGRANLTLDDLKKMYDDKLNGQLSGEDYVKLALPWSVEDKVVVRKGIKNLETGEITWGEWSSKTFADETNPQNIRDQGRTDILTTGSQTVSGDSDDIIYVVVPYHYVGTNQFEFIDITDPENAYNFDGYTYYEQGYPSKGEKPNMDKAHGIIEEIKSKGYELYQATLEDVRELNEQLGITEDMWNKLTGETDNPNTSRPTYYLNEQPGSATYEEGVYKRTFIFLRKISAKATITYIDETTGKTLAVDEVDGKSGEDIPYNTDEKINSYLGQGYELVSNNYPQNAKFDSDSDENGATQNYVVKLKHTFEENAKTEEKVINRTITYVDQKGNELFPKVEQQVKFTRTGNIDKVTGEVIWNEWASENDTLDKVDSPKKDGYTASRNEVSTVVINANDSDINEQVVYAPDRGSVIINYIDETTGKNLLTDVLDGNNDQSVEYKNKIDEFLAKGYELISNELGDSDSITISPDETKTYKIVFKHGQEEVSEEKVVNRVIHYVFEDGKEAHPDYKYSNIKFNRTGTKDKVTGEIVWNKWSDPIKTFGQESPKIEGYTPDKAQTEDILVSADMDNIEETITYKSDQVKLEKAEITFIDDDDNGKNLGNITSEGKLDEKISFDKLADKLKEFEGKSYKIISNSFNGQSYKTGDNKFEVHLKHVKEDVSENMEIERTINFVDEQGNKLKDPVVQTLKFNRTGVKDKVTGKIVWNKVDSQKFASINTPEIEGYTTKQSKVNEVKVNYGDKDIVENVVYTKENSSEIVNPEEPTKPEKPNVENKENCFKVDNFVKETAQPIKPKVISENIQQSGSSSLNVVQSNQAKNEMPQLGDSDENISKIAALIGTILLGLVGVATYKKEKPKEN